MQRVIDGLRLAYDDTGTGDAIVLVHGLAIDRTIWAGQTAALARRGRVIGVDLRGSGESACGEGPALMETLAGDIFGLLEALGIERAVIAGHSLGGYVALAYFRMYAERVAGLALVASHVAADPPEKAAERDAEIAAITEHGLAPMADDFAEHLFAPEFAAAQRPTVAHVRDIISRQNAAGITALMAGMKERVDSADLLCDISVPALILAGDRDPFIPLETSERTAAAIADCELVTLPHVAHMPMLEAAAQTTAALERLMARSLREAAGRT